MGHSEITNCKRYLDVASLENVSAMTAANIQPAQAALFSTKSHTGDLYTRGQMAHVQGFSIMVKALMDSEEHTMAASSAASTSDNMLKYLQKNGASYVCLYHNGKTKEVCGNNAKAARREQGDDVDNGDKATSLSIIMTDESVPSHKLVPLLEVTNPVDFKEYARKSRDNQDFSHCLLLGLTRW